MAHERSNASANSYGPPKRRWEGASHQERPSKKFRPQNGQHTKPPATDVDILPRHPPELPTISADYETIVFTHPSVAVPSPDDEQMVNYDRLEFLGDAYLEIIATRLVFETYKSANAGIMCRLREAAVKNETLSKYSIMYGFDKKLRTTKMVKEGPKGWNKIYGDVFEAYAAAVVLSNPEDGEATLERWLRELWQPVLRQVELPDTDIMSNAKEALAKKLMWKDVKISYVDERPPIIYKGKSQETFFVGVYLDGWGWKNQHLGSGEGNSKGNAGARAASNAMDNHPLIDDIIAKRAAFLKEKDI